jgi:CHASE2 domain-containing sensor protein
MTEETTGKLSRIKAITNVVIKAVLYAFLFFVSTITNVAMLAMLAYFALLAALLAVAVYLAARLFVYAIINVPVIAIFVIAIFVFYLAVFIFVAFDIRRSRIRAEQALKQGDTPDSASDTPVAHEG